MVSGFIKYPYIVLISIAQDAVWFKIMGAQLRDSRGEEVSRVEEERMSIVV
jgi:hypothetical protein